MELHCNIQDNLTPELDRQISCFRDTRPVMAALGKALEVELKKIFREFDNTQPNKEGWARSHFWNRRVAQKTALATVTPQTATVVVASPEFIHKITGGRVNPKRGKTLALPANSEAKMAGGPRASGANLTFLLLAQGRLVGALLKAQSTQLRYTKKGVKQGKDQGGELMYWLVRYVIHKPHPEYDPFRPGPLRERINAAMGRCLAIVIPRLLRRQNG